MHHIELTGSQRLQFLAMRARILARFAIDAAPRNITLAVPRAQIASVIYRMFPTLFLPERSTRRSTRKQTAGSMAPPPTEYRLLLKMRDRTYIGHLRLSGTNPKLQFWNKLAALPKSAQTNGAHFWLSNASIRMSAIIQFRTFVSNADNIGSNPLAS